MAWKNPLAEARPMTIGIILLTVLWAVFQWRDPTPPPALDQILVAAFGAWFANEAIDRKSKTSNKKRKGEPSDGNDADGTKDEDDS